MALAIANLGQSSGTSAIFDALLWMAVIVGVIAGAVWLLLIMRRRFRHSAEDSSGGFTLDQLRALRDRGELTVTEFENLRRVALDQMRDSLQRKS